MGQNSLKNSRLSQSPLPLISGLGSWPQHEGLLSPSACQIYRRNFLPVGFIQSPTFLLMYSVNQTQPRHMKRDLNCFDFLRAVFRFRFIACLQIQSIGGRFIVLHLRTLPRLDLPDSHGAKKHYRLVLFCFECVHYRVRYKVFIFYVFFRGVCKPCNNSYVLKLL